MSDILTQPVNLKRNIPTFLPLAEAVQKLGLSRQVLIELIEAGQIEAVQLPSGEVLVSAEGNGYALKTKEEVIAEKYAHLRSQPISASEASRKYSDLHGVPISHQTFSRWTKAGHINAESDGYRLHMDEADVAYCAEVYAQKYREYEGRMSGVRIFDTKGNPYQLKYPEVAEQLRIERRQS
jgi:predicted site-specific integrase-resolvase